MDKMIRAAFSAMARAVFIYNALQGTQRQVPMVATLTAFEAATWPVSQEAISCTKEADPNQLVATVTSSTTTLPRATQPFELLMEKPHVALDIIFALQCTNPFSYFVHWAYRQN